MAKGTKFEDAYSSIQQMGYEISIDTDVFLEDIFVGVKGYNTLISKKVQSLEEGRRFIITISKALKVIENEQKY